MVLRSVSAFTRTDCNLHFAFAICIPDDMLPPTFNCVPLLQLNVDRSISSGVQTIFYFSYVYVQHLVFIV